MFYQQDVAQVAAHFHTDTEHGLTEAQLGENQAQYGENTIPKKGQTPWFVLLLLQFHNSLIYVLLFATVVSYALDEVADAIIIFLAVLANVLIGFAQEYKAENALSALEDSLEAYCIVIRDGQRKHIPAHEVTVGDLLVLSAGNQVAADVRLVQAQGIEANEAILTGEAEAVNKQVSALQGVVPLAERSNMAFMGTTVLAGRGLGIVTAIGQNTEIGKIAHLLQAVDTVQTPLQKQLAYLSRQIMGLVTILAVIIFFAGIFFGQGWQEMFSISIATAVAAIPEGLTIAVTVILATGMHRILKQNAIIKRLIAAETLGSTDIICTDKTGTITQGLMSVQAIATSEGTVTFDELKNLRGHMSPAIRFMINVGVLGSNSFEQEGQVIGNMTENALFSLAQDIGMSAKRVRDEFERIDYKPFNSTDKYLASVHDLNGERTMLVIGAPEIVMAQCTQVRRGKRHETFEGMVRKRLENTYEQYAQRGYRVIAVAQKQFGTDGFNDMAGCELLGLFILQDALRPDVAQTVQLAADAGIRTILITGDHKNTAQEIGHSIGLDANEDSVLTGAELDGLTDFSEAVQKAHVYARVTPAHKLKIVESLQAQGHIVAMTGDGVNDAPALKAADIGIAVGNATDVTKGAADMVLVDNNLKTIVSAIEQGRIIVDNMKKVIVYLMADSFSAVLIILGALLLGLPLPLTAAQILWINLLTDSFPYMALTFEKGEDDVMQRGPTRGPILDNEMKALIFIISIVVDILSLGLYWYYIKTVGDIAFARTIVFALFGSSTLLYSFSCKSLRKPLWKSNPLDNKFLIWGVGAGFALLFSSIYIPILSGLLKVERLFFEDWILILSLAMFKVLLIEAVKYYYYRFDKV